MASFKFTNKAVDDITNIWNYTFDKWSENQADNYYRLLLDNCNEVASNPALGKSYDGITRDLKGLKAGRHIIFYREIKDEYVEITRILHEQMDLKSRMFEK